MKYYFLLCLTLWVGLLQAQNPNVDPAIQAQVRSEISKRGLSEEEVRSRLMAEGIDVDRLTMQELPAVQSRIAAIIDEMASAKQAAMKAEVEQAAVNATERKAQEIATSQSENIQEKVEEGASLEEAIAEEIIEQNIESLGSANIYGHQVFKDKSLELYRATKDIAPPSSYILGPGDIISINIFGASQTDLQFEIEEDGFIRPQGMLKVYLKGLSLGDAKELLRKRFAQAYLFSAGQFSVSLNTARTMTINIFGEVGQAGSYTLSALNTAFNALIAAGGPTEEGSVREIKLIRNGEHRFIDVYEWMLNPQIQFDFYLENNDILFVPPRKKLVSLSGAVKRPMSFELKEGENLSSLLYYAGGLTSNAYTDLIQIRRIEEEEPILMDINLTELMANTQDFILRDNDRISIKSIAKGLINYVNIDGAVYYPGDYQYEEGMRISDLLEKAFVREEARLDLAFLSRRSKVDGSFELIPIDISSIQASQEAGDNLLLKPLDNILLFTNQRYLDTYSLSISGSVRSPRKVEYDSAIRLSDLVQLAGGLKETAMPYAYIIRKDLKDPKRIEYIRIDLEESLKADAELELQPMDEIRILDRATFSDQSTVSIGGAVHNGGEFQYDESLKLSDLITLAGGLRLEAAANRVEVFRILFEEDAPTKTMVLSTIVDKSVYIEGGSVESDFELQPFDQVIVRTIPDFRFQETVNVSGEVNYPGAYALVSDNEKLLDLIERAGGVNGRAYIDGATLYRNYDNKGYITIDLAKAFDKPGGYENIVLRAGDVIEIPPLDQTVTIYLAGTKASELPTTKIQSNRMIVPFTGTHSAKWYIKEFAGGFAKKAKKSKTTVEYQNGKVEAPKSRLFFRDYPDAESGAVVRTEMKPKKVKKEKKERTRGEGNAAELFTNTLTTLTAVLTLVLLVQQLN